MILVLEWKQSPKNICQLIPQSEVSKSISSYGNTTSEITDIQTYGHTANFSYRPGSKVLVLQAIWNTDSQQNSLSIACVIFGRGIFLSKWE
jgi:hypothetical protein